MGEFTVLSQIQNEPIALLALLILVIYKTIAIIVPLIKKKDDKVEETKDKKCNCTSLSGKLEKIEALLEKHTLERKEDALERIKRQEEVDARLDKHYEYIKEAVIQSGVGVVWTPGVPFVELVNAALLNIRLGKNGNLQEKLVEAIMKEPNGITTYKSLLNAFILEHGPKMSKHFNTTIDWIEKRII